MDLALNNGTIYYNGELVKANIGIENGKIFRISKERIIADESIDCNGKIVLPGIIDEHVHFRVPGNEHKEDWKTGSKAAIAGGVTTVLEMPNTNPPTTTQALLEEKREIAERDSFCNYGFHFGATNENFNEMETVTGINSIKVFMGSSTGNLLIEDENILKKVFETAKKRNLVVTLHAEDEQLIKQNFERTEEKNHAIAHNKIRNNETELKAIEKAIGLNRNIGAKLHFLHVTTKQGIELIARTKKRCDNISCEVTPNHLFLTEQFTREKGNLGKINPPLRSKEDVQALWKAINNGTVDCIATDHAPHTIEEKNQEYLKAPSGIPGIETMLPLLLNAFNQNRISLQKIIQLCSENPARIFNLRNKGKIALNNDADLTIIDLKKEKTIKNEELQTKCRWTPFNEKKLKGTIEKTIVKGIAKVI